MIKLNLNQFYNEGVLNLSAFTDALTEAQAGDTEGALTYLGGFLDHYKAASSDTVVERIGKDLLAEVFIVTPTSSIDWPTGNVESVLHGEGYMVVFQFKPATQESAAIPPDILRINLTALFVDDLVGPQTMLESILEKAQKDGRWAVSVETMQQTRDALFLNIDLFREIVMRYDVAVLDIFVPDGDRVASWTTHSQKASFEQQRADDNIIRPRFLRETPENLRPRFNYQTQGQHRHSPYMGGMLGGMSMGMPPQFAMTEPEDKWPSLTNQGIVELLNAYSLTQINDFPMGVNVQGLPHGLDLLRLIQVRLRGIPSMFPGGVFQANIFNDQRFNKPQGVFDAAREAMRGAYRPTGSAGQPGGCEAKFIPRLKLHFVPGDADTLQDFLEDIRRSVDKQIGLAMSPSDRIEFSNRLVVEIRNVLERDPLPGKVVQDRSRQVTLETGYPVQLTRGLMVDYMFTNWILYPRTDVNKDGAITGPLDWLRWGGGMMDDYRRESSFTTAGRSAVTDSFSFVLNMSMSITMEHFAVGLYTMFGLLKPQLDDHVREVTKTLQSHVGELFTLMNVVPSKEVQLHYTTGRIETLAEGLQKMLRDDYSGWCIHSDLVHSDQYDMKVPAFVVTGSGMWKGQPL